ncbi:UPF0193 protein EVG1 isoform X2 [Sphaeramia orbicularis]|nr:UPF0193 protein EVG1 isoform X2 [Sphaeramia orbicularis]XP_029990098.1 UPF0193 protein EVG1 isoform X2 [Sphaeramia orbicularis]
MEMFSGSTVSGGLWNHPRPSKYSKETQEMLRVMTQELKLTNIQRKQISECIKNGKALPLPSDFPSSSAVPSKPKTSRPSSNYLPTRPQRRTAEMCRSGNSYTREKFQPGPTRDLEKEKWRLQNILEKGKDEPVAVPQHNPNPCPNPDMEEKDRYQEVLDEIEERRQFLADMASLGQEKDYTYMINTEISQRIRELELMDKTRSSETEAMTFERKVRSAEHTEEKVESRTKD